MKLKPTNLAIATMFATLALPSLAKNTVLKLDEMVITGAVYEQPLDQTSANVSIINRRQLNKIQADDLSSSVRYEPGVTVNNDAARYANSGYNIRGIEGDRIVTMVDGVRMNNGYTPEGPDTANVVSRGGVEFDTIRQVDIVKGPFSALYGNDALGGAVNFNTWRPSDLVSDAKPYHFGFKQSFNSKNSGRASTLTTAAKAGMVSGLVIFTKRDSKETKTRGIIGGEGKDRTKASPQNYDIYNLLSKLSIGDQTHKVDLSAELFNQNRNTDALAALGPVVKGGIITIAQILDKKGEDKLKRQRFGAEYSYRVNAGMIRALSASYAYHQTKANNRTNTLQKDFFPLSEGNILELFSYQQTSHNLRSQLNAIVEQQHLIHNIIAGVEYRTDSFKPYDKVLNQRKSSPNSQQTNFDLYLLDELQFNNGFTVSPALRYSRYALKPKHDSEYLADNPTAVLAQKLSDSRFSPSLSFKLPLSDTDTAFLALSTGFKSPPIKAMSSFTTYVPIIDYTATYEANPNLKSETSQSAELGWRHRSTNWDAKLTSYYNKYRNFIDQKIIKGGNPPFHKTGTQTYLNRAKVTTYGIEMAASYNFANHLQLSSALAWMKGKDGDEKLDSVQPPKLMLGVGYNQTQWGVNLDISLVKAIDTTRSTQPNDRQSSLHVPGYGLVDLTAYWNPSKNISLTAGVYNLTDKKYWHAADLRYFNADSYPNELYSQPRRSFAASIKIDF